MGEQGNMKRHPKLTRAPEVSFHPLATTSSSSLQDSNASISSQPLISRSDNCLANKTESEVKIRGKNAKKEAKGSPLLQQTKSDESTFSFMRFPSFSFRRSSRNGKSKSPDSSARSSAEHSPQHSQSSSQRESPVAGVLATLTRRPPATPHPKLTHNVSHLSDNPHAIPINLPQQEVKGASPASSECATEKSFETKTNPTETIKGDELLKATMKICLVVSPPSSKLQVIVIYKVIA